jgi:hypothetical protein
VLEGTLEEMMAVVEEEHQGEAGNSTRCAIFYLQYTFSSFR